MNTVVVDRITNTVTVNQDPPVHVSVSQPLVVVQAIAQQGPPGPPGQNALSNVSMLAGDGIQGGGLLVSDVTVSVDASVARVGGVLWLDEANARVGINQLDPKIDLQIGDTGIGSYSVELVSTFPNQIVDQWSASEFRSAKYLVQVHAHSPNEYEISEIFLLHNNGEVYLTEYAVVNEGTRLAQFSASIFGDAVRLLCTPLHAINTVKVSRTVITV